MSTTRSLLLVNGIVFGTIVLGMLNNILVAKFFGLTRLLDSYYVALVVPEICTALFLDFLGRNFLPTYAEVVRQDAARAARLASAVITIVGVAAVAAVVIIMVAAKVLFSTLLPGFAEDELDHVVLIFYIVSPAIVLMAINTFNEYIYQYREQYARMAIYRAAVPGSVLVAIIFGHSVLREYALAIGFLGGHLLMFFLFTWKAGYRYRPRLSFESGYLRRIFFNSGILIAAGFVGRTRSLISQFFCSLLGPGSYSALTLAHKLSAPLHQSSLLAMRIIVFSKSVRMHVNQEHERLGELYTTMLSLVLLVLTPIMFWVVLECRPIIEVLFMRGEFTSDMSNLVVLATIGVALGIPFAGANETLSNAYYATNRSGVIAAVIPAGTVLFLFCVAVLYERLGVLGIALSETAVELLVFIVLTTIFARQNAVFSFKYLLGKLSKYFLVSAFTVYLTVSAIDNVAIHPLLRLLASFATGIGLYLSVLYLAKDRELRLLVERLLDAVRERAEPAVGSSH